MKKEDVIRSRIGLLSFWIKDSESKIELHKGFLKKHKKEITKLLREIRSK